MSMAAGTVKAPPRDEGHLRGGMNRPPLCITIAYCEQAAFFPAFTANH